MASEILNVNKYIINSNEIEITFHPYKYKSFLLNKQCNLPLLFIMGISICALQEGLNEYILEKYITNTPSIKPASD